MFMPALATERGRRAVGPPLSVSGNKPGNGREKREGERDFLVFVCLCMLFDASVRESERLNAPVVAP